MMLNPHFYTYTAFLGRPSRQSQSVILTLVFREPACQHPLCQVGFLSQEYSGGLPSPSQGSLQSGIELESHHCRRILTTEPVRPSLSKGGPV